MKALLLALIAFAISPTLQAQEPQEIISERSLYSKMYINNDGSKEEIISPSPIHYLQNNEWLPIDQNLLAVDKRFINTENIIQSSFPTIINSDALIDLSFENVNISIEAKKELVTYSELNGVEQLNVPFNQSNGVISENELVYDNVFNGYSDKFTVLAGEVKNDFTINNYPQELANVNGGYFGFQERFALPLGWTLEPMTVQNSDLIHSGIYILDQDENRVFSIPAPVFYDGQGMTNDGVSMVEGGFIIDMDENGWLLSTVVPVSWLNDPALTYPVTLDPTVTMAGATGGWQSQNNYVNNPGYVFIGVCCGNLEHRAWIQFNTTSIDDASCVTAVELQVYVNGVGSTAAELVHAYDMTGAFGPYGSILPAVYTDMGDGYYTSFTLTGTGYYGYYDLGPSAAALLQTQLTTMNAFQVSLIFDNEPSTAWKRLSATLCNLRIAYDDPPCAPLPVGLVNFETKCENDQAHLSWSTITESNSDYFTVWKSIDGKEFVEAGKVQANGNSTSTLHYRWVDLATNDETAYYKLTQTDLDGTIQDFDAKLYHGCKESDPVVFTDNSNAIRIRGNHITQVEIRDNMGRLIASESNNGDQNEMHLSNNALVSGVYSVTITYDHGKQKTLQFLFNKD